LPYLHCAATRKENPGGGTPGFSGRAIGIGGTSTARGHQNSIDQQTSRLILSYAAAHAIIVAAGTLVADEIFSCAPADAAR
jgi:hypothetical protein